MLMVTGCVNLLTPPSENPMSEQDDPRVNWGPGEWNDALEEARAEADRLRIERDRFDDEAERLGIVKEEYRAEADQLRDRLQKIEGNRCDECCGFCRGHSQAPCTCGSQAVKIMQGYLEDAHRLNQELQKELDNA
jgi:hypothetical protein